MAITKIECIKADSLVSLEKFCQGLISLTEITFAPEFDTSGVLKFGDYNNNTGAWYDCPSLTSFPLIDTSSGVDFSSAWAECSSLTSFPLIDTSSGVDFYNAWYGCSSLTSFPLIDTSSGVNFSSAWDYCSFTSFPLIDTSSGVNFSSAWHYCSFLTSFPLINTSSGVDFSSVWSNCLSLKCLSGVDTRLATNTTSMFFNTPALLRPNSAEQTAIQNHALWINDTPCPLSPISPILWTLQQSINNPKTTYSVSLYQDTLVVGAWHDGGILSVSGAVYIYTRSGSTWTLQQSIDNPSPTYTDDKFGYSVSLYQDTLVVGAWNDGGVWTNFGTVYVYTRSGSTWTLQQNIISPTSINPSPESEDRFGYSVSLYQDTLVVGTPRDDYYGFGVIDDGSAYVYTRSGSIWTLQQTIINPTPADDENFGISVSLYQDTLVVGATTRLVSEGLTPPYSGSVYLYTRSGSTWTLQQTIDNFSYGHWDHLDNFAYSVSLYQDTLVVGAPRDNVEATDDGSASVYTRSGSTWTLQQTINNPSPGNNDDFGYSVSLYQDTLVVGTPWNDIGPWSSAGSAFVYTRSDSTWTLQQTIDNPSPYIDDNFGYAISLYGDTLAVITPGDEGAGGEIPTPDDTVFVYTGLGS